MMEHQGGEQASFTRQGVSKIATQGPETKAEVQERCPHGHQKDPDFLTSFILDLQLAEL